MKLDKSVAIISGAGAGIGAATAILFAKNGIMTSMDELKEVARNEGIRSILEGLGSTIQENYKTIKW